MAVGWSSLTTPIDAMALLVYLAVKWVLMTFEESVC